MTSIPAGQRGLISSAAAGAGLPLPVTAAQVSMESGFNPKAVSGAGAQGEFQFMPGTFASQHTGGSPFNPNDEARAYAKLMSTLLRQYHGNVRNALAAYNAGPGNIGAGFGYADKILAAAGAGSGLNIHGSNRSLTTRIPGTPAQRFKTQIGGGLNTEALARAVLQKEAARPIDTTGKISTANPLKDYAAAADSGRFNASTINSQNTLPGTPAEHGSLRMHGHVGVGNINPLGPEWRLTETDQGVDAVASPGSPIRALADSRVVSIVPNWYAGQPFMVMQILDGPDKGKYWYVSEQIAALPHIGAVVREGDTVARFADHGTGIEIGWASGRPGQTLAQAQHPGSVATRHLHGTPEGIGFSRGVLHHAPVSVS